MDHRRTKLVAAQGAAGCQQVKTLRGAVALCALLPSALLAQVVPPTTVAPVIPPPPPKQEPTALVVDRRVRIDTWVESLVAQGKIPGAVVTIVRNGQIAYTRAYGVRDVATKAPLRSDDIFRIASQTKAITSVAALMLWEEGKFQLDDPVEMYLPSFKAPKVLTKFNAADSSYESRPARRKPTIRQLFTHTSGLDYAEIGSDEFKAIYAKAGITALGREGDVLAERIDVLGRLPLRSEPGERFNYSNSVDVLGRLVEIWSGMPLDQFMRKRIFEPLGMRDTWFELPADRRARLVALHQPNKAGVLEAAHDATAATHPDFPARKVTYFSGGGGLASTTGDYARFLQCLLDGGTQNGERLLGRKTVELMLTNQMGTLQPAFGLGFALETPENDFRSPMSLGTFSWGGAFKTTYWADPKERLVGLIFTNLYGSDLDLDGPFKVLVYQALR